MDPLDVTTVNPDPIRQFKLWFDQACLRELPDQFNAMDLATISLTGAPANRVVLMKSVDEHGFVFYTNYNSRKGRELAANPNVALCFFWPVTDRQVRIEGTSEKVSAEESDEYFASRPRESRLGAWASNQSDRVLSRAAIEDEYRRLLEEFDGREVPRPPHWGGYRVTPTAIEFMQRRTGRMHDRILYTRTGDTWEICRLAP